MLKETITYDDFDGVSTTEEMYFNLTKLELTELAMELPDGLAEEVDMEAPQAAMLSAIAAKMGGNKGIIEFVKRLVLKAYGIKRQGADGKMKFIKNEQIAEEFASSMAYHNFVMELMTDDEKSMKFFSAVIPSDMAAQIPAGIATEAPKTKKSK